MKNDPKLKTILNTFKVITCYRKGRNIGQRLCNGANLERDIGVRRCEDKRCLTCPALLVGDSFAYKDKSGNNKMFHIKSKMTCESKSLLYLLKCAGCGGTYIGQTGDILSTE